MNNKFYITTTLPYVNADPHIGHTLEFIQADVIARYFRSQLGDENVFFNIGMDEHGLKIFTKAAEAGKTPQEYADFYAGRWQEFAKLFNISYDSFYRTTSEAHHKAAQEFWSQVQAKGDIYKKHYQGLYCVGHESFITEKELVDGKCPDHGTVPVEFSEENYFFKLSKYKQALLDFYQEHPEVVKPAHKLKELVNWIKDMDDISISRIKKNLPWGIEVPNDPEQVFYVWFDALTNYVNAVGFGTDPQKLAEWWPGTQLFGSDNLRFQGAIWQGMLASVGLPFTKKLLCHGMVLAADGVKMSKTIGNVVSPFDQAQKYDAEIIRFYMIAGLSTYGDPAYKEDDLKVLYNAWLANNFGNLLNRVIHLAEKLECELNNPSLVEPEFKTKVDDLVANANNLYQEFELQQAANVINTIADFGNKYIDQHKPWEKTVTQAQAQITLNNLSYLLANLIELYQPIIPQASARAKEALATRSKIILFTKLE
jgi:methionyl-tRNA synthetase